MSKIEANKLELSYVSFNFEKMLQKVVNVINFRIDERNQDFRVSVDKDIPQTLIGDDQRLAQVITNLLSNAVKFTPEGGLIRLNTRLLSSENDVFTIQIEVTDSGIGISQEQQARLFTSFEQAESGTSRKFGGTGLGLAISKRIVEMMDGKIWIESTLGEGATFAFTMQAKRGHSDAMNRLNPGVNWHTVKAMVVDDDLELLNYFKEITTQFGIRCDAFESGDAALEAIRLSGGYDLYFVDCKMPGMSGFELTKHIKENTTQKSVVIMISGVDRSTIEEEASAAGVDRFLTKPLFPSSIADCINDCLGVNTIQEEQSEDIVDESFEDYHLLLAEDVEINREILMALLEPTNLNIDCAVNGAEAFRMFRDNQDAYDMIFMDVQMPEMDGYEATRSIRAIQSPQALAIPIVAMTANVFREDIERCIAAGMNDHVGKPLDLESVIGKLKKYLPKHEIPSSTTPILRSSETGQEETWKYGIAWRPEYTTGHEEIDLQHKQLFRLTSDLVAACNEGQQESSVDKALEFLANYTVQHFESEERLQIEYRYPDYLNHKQLHDDFKQTVTELIERHKENGSSAELAKEVNSVVVKWLTHHIQIEDMKIAAHIREQEKTV
jgi:hemerythrin-like metal-binding protein